MQVSGERPETLRASDHVTGGFRETQRSLYNADRMNE